MNNRKKLRCRNKVKKRLCKRKPNPISIAEVTIATALGKEIPCSGFTSFKHCTQHAAMHKQTKPIDFYEETPDTENLPLLNILKWVDDLQTFRSFALSCRSFANSCRKITPYFIERKGSAVIISCHSWAKPKNGIVFRIDVDGVPYATGRLMFSSSKLTINLISPIFDDIVTDSIIATRIVVNQFTKKYPQINKAGDSYIAKLTLNDCEKTRRGV